MLFGEKNPKCYKRSSSTLTLLWEFGTFVQPNYVFTSTLCYSAKKIRNVTKRSSSTLTLLWEFGTFVQPNYVFTSTLCYSAKKIPNVTKTSSLILTLLWELETFFTTKLRLHLYSILF